MVIDKNEPINFDTESQITKRFNINGKILTSETLIKEMEIYKKGQESKVSSKTKEKSTLKISKKRGRPKKQKDDDENPKKKR